MKQEHAEKKYLTAQEVRAGSASCFAQLREDIAAISC